MPDTRSKVTKTEVVGGVQFSCIKGSVHRRRLGLTHVQLDVVKSEGGNSSILSAG